jgi:hypothetical protein
VLRQQACKQVLRAPATCMASAATARPGRQMQGKQGTLQAPAGLLLSARRQLQRPAGRPQAHLPASLCRGRVILIQFLKRSLFNVSSHLTKPKQDHPIISNLISEPNTHDVKAKFYVVLLVPTIFLVPCQLEFLCSPTC